MGNSTFAAFQAGQPNEKTAAGTPNKYLKGEKPEDCAFANQGEMIEAMSSELYSTDAEYRDAVAIMVANSDFGGATLNGEEVLTSNEAKAAQRKADWLAEEDRQCAMESAQELFGNPAYEKSATYRRFVRQQLEANSELIDKTLGKQINGGTRIKPTRIQFTGEEYAEVQASIRKEREDKLKADAKEAADAAARHAAAPFVDVLGGNDDEGSEE